VEELGKSEQERDDSFAWLENLAAKQGATEGLLTRPEDRMEQEPEWVRQAKELGTQQPQPSAAQEESAMEQPASIDDTAAWLKNLEEEEKQPKPVSAADETAIWLKKLEQAEAAAEPVDAEMPDWMKDIDQAEAPAVEPIAPVQQAEPLSTEMPAEESEVPSWLSDLEKEEESLASTNALTDAGDLPAWLRDETGEVVAEPVKIEPTRPTDWKPSEPKEPEIRFSPPIEEEPKQPEIIYSPPLEEPIQPEPEPPVVTFEEQPAPPPAEPAKPARKTPPRPGPAQEPYKEPVTRRGTGMLVMPGIDPLLGTARSELSRSNIPGALESYARLIKKGRFLDEVIYDLREALYRYPVEVSIWQSLGDAYMRANRLQDALDAYTKAEELLR
jgi:tetratricopeptide (TPR) repeat protein